MSNKVAFDAVVIRAKMSAESRSSLLQSPGMNVPVDVLLYANRRIAFLESEIAKLKAELYEVQS